MNSLYKKSVALLILLFAVGWANAQNIDFADANVKAICVANWDTDGDDELSMDEAAAVTDLGYVFSGNTGITSFNELVYFTSLTSIGENAFSDCASLSSINIPNSVTNIGDGAFWGAGIASITIPNSVQSIGGWIVSGCVDLEHIIVEEGNPAYDSRDNCNAIIETSTNMLIAGCKNTVIPDSVTSIGESAFDSCLGLTTITIPSSVTEIGGWAFYGTGLTSITIPSLVNIIGSGAFAECTHVSQVNYNATNCADIEDAPFEGCSGTLVIGNNVQRIPAFMFAVANFTGTLTIPNSVTTIGDNPFVGCTGLETISVETGNQVYDSRDNCNAIIETGTNTMVVGLANTIIPNTVVSIGYGAFATISNLYSINIPNSVTTIEDFAFVECNSLSSITIPGSVESIGDQVFTNCEGLTSITLIATTPPTLGSGVFDGVDKTIPVYVPVGTVSDYQAAEGWNEFTNFIAISSGVITVTALPAEAGTVTGAGSFDAGSVCTVTATANDNYVFAYWSKEGAMVSTSAEYSFVVVADGELVAHFVPMGNIDFADVNVKAICVANWDTNSDGELSYVEASHVTHLYYTFTNNSDISSFNELQYFTGLVSIEEQVFEGCINLSSITLPNSVETIGLQAFLYCSSLTSITIPDMVTSIGENAFSDCASLSSIILPNSVTTIGAGAFYNCSSLASMVIPNSVEEIGAWTFGGCNGLASIEIPNSVTNIGEYAFNWCNNLSSITVMATTPPTLGSDVFDGVNKSIPVYVPIGTVSAYQAAEGWNEFTYYIEIQTIDFADANVETICLNLWDNDQDGLLSFAEAEAVTDLGTAFQNHTEITSFNELQYFMGLTAICAHAFEGCTALAGITIPVTITNIGEEAFSGCTGLTSMDVESMTPPVLGTAAFQEVDKSIPVHVPDGSTSAYRAAPGWEEFFNYVETNILFADAQVEAICLANWDTDENGKLSYEEAAAVTDLGNVFQGNEDITSFDELQYFTGLNSLVYENGDWWGSFSGCNNLISVIIPNTVMIIGESAFEMCASLTSIAIPNSVTSLGGNTFAGCTELVSVDLGNTVTSIGEYAFGGCEGLTSITIPNSVTEIGEAAFGESGLTSITIPNSVSSVGIELLYGCVDLEQIIVEEGNPTYDSRDNCNAIIETGTNKLISGCKNTIIPESVTSIGVAAFEGCSSLTSITIPSSVTAIGEGAFVVSGLISITIPNSVTSIGDAAFAGCEGLTTITVTASTPPTLGSDVFNGVDKSIPVYVPVGTVSDYQAAEGWNEFTNIIGTSIGDITAAAEPAEAGTVTGAGHYEYQTCTLTATANEGYVFVRWLENGEEVSTDAVYTFPVTGDRNLVAHFALAGNIIFADANVKAICVANWDTDSDGEISYAEAEIVTDLGNVFLGNEDITSFEELQYFTGLTSLEIEGSWQGPFSGCTNLASIVIPNSVTSIGEGAFESCTSLTTITIPSSVTRIGEGAFYGTGITSITIPSSVSTIGDWSFGECVDLEQIIVEEGNPTYDSRDNCNSIIETGTNKLIAGCKTTVIPNSVIRIGEYAFESCSSLTSITIPNSVTEIGEGAFAGSGLVSITIPNSVTSIGDYAFNWCEGLNSITILNSVTSIGDYAFAGCTSLASITIPNSVTSIGNYAFAWCEGLTSITVTATTPPTLGSDAFQDVDKSIPLYVPTGTINAYASAEGWNEFLNIIEYTIVFADANVKAICLAHWDTDQDGEISFVEAAAVTDLGLIFQNHTEIASFNELQYFTGLTSIGDHAFEGCTALAEITIPEAVANIGVQAFSSCTGLAEIHLLAETPAALGIDAFLNVPNAIPVWIPCETLGAYSAAPGWDNFTNFIDFCLSNIVFADTNVKAICVANWDSNEDGEISYAEAAAVTDLGNVFQSNESITSFNELQYFTGLTGIESNAFRNCTNLISVIIPNSVTSIGRLAFLQCYSLTSLDIPNSVIEIVEFAFAECASLTSMVIPNSVTTIGTNPFPGCTNLETISVASDNTVYDSRNNCNAIIETSTNTLVAGCMNTTVPNTVAIIDNSAFLFCTGLTSIIVPSSVTIIGNNAFAQCTGLTSMIIFNANVEMGDGAFEGVNIPETTFIAASASPAEGGGLLGVYGENNNSYQSFMGTYDVQNYIVEYAPQGNGQLYSTEKTILASHHNEGWQFAGWYLNGELVSYNPVLSFRAFGSFAFEAFFEPCSYLPDPELLSGRFSISGCSTVGFTKSNAIIKGDLMNALSGVYAEFSVITGNGMPGCAYEFGENQWDCMTYDSTALANGIYVELMSTTGADLIPQFYFKGNEDCWHILTGSEWDYLLNQRITESGVRFAFAKVNDVNGLVILPDDWIAGTYMFAHFNEISDYQNNVITSGSWLATLEPAGAVFLPVNGIVNALGSMAYLSGNGEMGAYPGLFISPSGSFLGTELPMTGDIVNVFTSLFGTSLRLAQITPQPNTVTINVATEQSERGIVTGGGEVNCGQTCTVTATANPGYVFQFWKENGQIVSTETIYSFKAKGNRDLVAQFANVDEVCNVVFDLMGPTIGWGGNALHVEYEGVSFELTMPTPEALSFFELESMMGSSETITKTYPVFIDRDATVNLSWYSALGEMPGSGASFAIHYEDGDMIFEGDEESLAEPYQFVCSCEDVSCEIIAFSMPSSDYGNVYGGGMYTYGETCTLIAYANDGYHFTGWKENDVLVCESPVYQFTVTSSRLLWAEFAVNNYYTFSLATEPEEGGVLYAIEDDMPYPIETPYSSYEPVEEMDLSIWAKAKEGWRFAYWTANDEIVSYDNFYHFHLSRDADLVAHFVECEFEPQPDENLLSGRFSVSGCTTVGFAKGNMIAQFQIDTIFTYNLIGTSWQFAETQYYRQEYDSLAIVENGISPQLLSSGMDLISGLNQAMGLVDIGCWHELSGSEWDYLLNQRDAEVRYAFAEVDGVSGLLVLPDNWQSAIYALNAPNAAADYATNPITLSEWENILEPAGALFLPANGTIEKMGMSSSSNYIYALNGTDGEQYRPVGIYGELMFAPFAQEPIGGGVMTGIIGMDMMMAQIDMYSCKRLAQIVQMETSTVNVIASQTEHGLVSGEGQFACNAECTLTATPNEGYVFQYWMEGSSVVSVENPYVFTVEGDRSLTAVFVDADEVCNVQFDLDCGSNSYGMFGMGGEALQLSFDDGTPDIHLTMPVPKIDWYAILFAQMIGETFDPTTYGFPTSCSYSIPINKGTDVDMSLVPLQLSVLSQMGSSNPVSNTFSASYVFGDPIVENSGSGDTPSFQCNCEGFIVNLNLSVDPEEGGEIQTEGFPNYGEAVTVTAVANEGYHFVNWTFNGTVVSTEPTYSLVAMEDGDLVAHFDINYYEVTAVANPEEGGTVTSGTDIVFVLYDSYGDGWNGNQLLVYFNGSQIPNNYLTLYSGSSTVIHVPISSGSTVTLAWQTGSYPEECSFKVCYADGTLIYSCTSPRTSLPYSFVCNGNNGTYPYGSICTLMAEANEGYTFVNWMENGEVVSTDYWYEFEVTSDRELVANFSPPITITATANPSEGGTVTGAGTFDYGTYCTLTATPNEGFVFSAWTEDGEVAATDAIYGFTVTQERHLVAEFLPLYTITVSANPNEGGMVNGDGIYAEGSTCTLTATTNTGYTFISWTREGAVISAEPTYTFTVTGAGDYVANFSLKTYEITAMVTPTEAGTVNGTGTYTHGTQCTLTAMPGEDYTFMYWFEGGNMVSYDATYSFIATGDRSFVAHFAENEQTFILESGWTWLSSYIEMEDINGLAMLENGLNPNGVMIKSQRDGFLSYANGMWIGTLDAITNEKMYLVNTSASTEVIITGPVAQLNAHPITLNPNWTWLGYPSPFAMDIDDALSNLNPTNGDVVKSQSSFAAYNDVDGWYGTLSTLTPGMGLMYQSHNSQPVTFNYGVGMNRALRANLTAEDNHWVPDVHAYPNNMNIMAVVELNGVELENERYELAIFDGNECRGSVRLIYVESMRRYVAFLTVAGEEDAELCLALYDTMTGEAYYNTTDCLNFEANAVLGSLSMPYIARFGGTAELNELGDPTVVLYPNPVSAGHLFQMALPDESKGARVSIVNALGAVVSTTDVYDKPAILCAPAVPGVYTVRIVTAKQGTYCRKLIVK